jgi:hypothetical protein
MPADVIRSLPDDVFRACAEVAIGLMPVVALLFAAVAFGLWMARFIGGLIGGAE